MRGHKRLQFVPQLAHPIADGARGRLGWKLSAQVTTQDIRTEVHRDENVGAHGPRQRHGHGIDEPAVNQHHSVVQHRRE